MKEYLLDTNICIFALRALKIGFRGSFSFIIF